MTDEEKAVLQKAREIYGNKNQILVCMEELNELGCILAKYPRYEDENKAVAELKEKALDELSDVLIITEHVKAIFGFTEFQINTHISNKIKRMTRWLDKSNSMEQTLKDRSVSKCNECRYGNGEVDTFAAYQNVCSPCLQAQSETGEYPGFHRIEE